MFGSIARRYDLANHLLSCGCDVIWRKRAAGIVATWDPNTIVDLAAGTGDLTLALEKALPNSEVVAADFSDQMLAVARAKGVRRVVSADALALPFSDRSFDCLTIAFGLQHQRLERGIARNGTGSNWEWQFARHGILVAANVNLTIALSPLPSSVASDFRILPYPKKNRLRLFGRFDRTISRRRRIVETNRGKRISGCRG